MAGLASADTGHRTVRELFVPLPGTTEGLFGEKVGRSQDNPMNMNEKYKILFVCLGNICRSPAAEAVFRDRVEKAGLAGRFEIDSAG